MAQKRGGETNPDAKLYADEPEASLPSPHVRQSTGQAAVPEEPAPYPIDEVEEASLESFPASDPPAFGTGHA